MKRLHILSFVILMLAIMAAPSFAQSKKKPASVYVKTAKIELSNDDEARWHVAIAFLDTLFIHWGHTSEGLFMMREVYTKLIDNTGNLDKKSAYVTKMAAYMDSLQFCCENKEIKKKLKKDCKKLLKANDETRVRYWTEYYNAGVAQVNEIQQVAKDGSETTDSTEKAFYTNRLQALLDTCEVNMNMAITLNKSDHRPYAGLASVYTSKGEPAQANEWLVKALEYTDDRLSLVQDVAYSYINQDKYCDAIPYLNEFVESIETDTANTKVAISTLYNLSVCYNRCEQIDEATKVYHRILAIDNKHTESLTNLGRIHRITASNASDSMRFYTEQGDSKTAEVWENNKNLEFDSTLYFLKQVFDLMPDDERVATEYAIINYIRENYTEAIVGFKRSSELKPENSDNWISLGDCYIFLQDYENAIVAYEQVVALKPNDKKVIENLVDLYKTTGNNAKSKEMADRLKTL